MYNFATESLFVTNKNKEMQENYKCLQLMVFLGFKSILSNLHRVSGMNMVYIYI